MSTIKSFLKSLFTHDCEDHAKLYAETWHEDGNVRTLIEVEYKCKWCGKISKGGIWQ